MTVNLERFKLLELDTTGHFLTAHQKIFYFT